MPSLGAYLLPVGIIHLIFGLALITIFPLPEGIGAWPLEVAVASGILRAVAVTILLYTLTREEVSRVIPVVHTYPIFVAISAVVLLGESLVYLQWLAIVIVVAGAVMVSLRQSPTDTSTWLGQSFGLLFASSLLMAGGDVAAKYALNYFLLEYVFYWCILYVFAFLSGLNTTSCFPGVARYERSEFSNSPSCL